jgi:hypothetical protein
MEGGRRGGRGGGREGGRGGGDGGEPGTFLEEEGFGAEALVDLTPWWGRSRR